MKILSLNINNFGGLKCKEEYKKNNRYHEWKAINKTDTATEIFSFIQAERPVIAILHEFELNSKIAQEFIDSMKIINYEIVQIEGNEYKDPSITIIFVNKELLYNKIDNPHKEKSLRANVIKTADFIIYGVHIPPNFDGEFWDETIEFYKKYKDKKLVIIGDFNVYDLGTDQKKKYLELLSLNAKDAWLEKGYSNSTSTHIKGRRLDYAIMTPLMYESLKSIRIDSLLLKGEKTDHSALIVEI